MNKLGGENVQQQAPYMQSNVNNAFHSGFQPPFAGQLNAVSKDDQMRQDGFGNFANNNNTAVPELELDNTGGFFHQQNLNGSQKKDGELSSTMGGNFQQPSSQQQQPSNTTKQLHGRLQSQDTMSSDVANSNFDGDWANSEDYLDQQFEENWSRRQAQFESDMSKGPLDAPNVDSGPFNSMQNTANNNFKMGGEQQWDNNTSGQQQHQQQQQQQMNGGQKVDAMGNFFGMENGQGAKVEFTPPAIVISNTDFSDNRPQSEGGHGSHGTDAMMEEEKKHLDGNGNFGMIITEANGNNTTGTTKHIFGDSSGQSFGGGQAHPFAEMNNNQDQMFSEMNGGALEQHQQDNSSIKPSGLEPGAVKSVTFNEEVEKKSPPHMTLSSLFGGAEPLVVQTATDEMSRARVRWINAFNKISSHLNEVCLSSLIALESYLTENDIFPHLRLPLGLPLQLTFSK